MTQTETETVPEQDVPGRTRWGVFLAILAVPTLVVAALLALLIAWLFTDDSVDTGVRKVSCAEAFAYGGAKPPTGVRDLACTLEAGQGPRYEARFLMRNAEVSAWVVANYPDGPALRHTQCEGTDVYACMSRDPAAGQNASVQIEVAHDSSKWSEVRYKAFAS
ncbi:MULTISPECIES: hypothetical protein [Streptomyces]|uniref:hypothetical protein n=1 Tax=Streptomyces TaxID=1883 RepID=UPI0010ED9433|nr:hypothetical protein [Streptomyces sp. BK205]TCR23837.1 hypothetical protein EV578_103157 [Streptomyces sp. BK205]